MEYCMWLGKTRRVLTLPLSEEADVELMWTHRSQSTLRAKQGPAQFFSLYLRESLTGSPGISPLQMHFSIFLQRKKTVGNILLRNVLHSISWCRSAGHWNLHLPLTSVCLGTEDLLKVWSDAQTKQWKESLCAYISGKNSLERSLCLRSVRHKTMRKCVH